MYLICRLRLLWASDQYHWSSGAPHCWMPKSPLKVWCMGLDPVDMKRFEISLLSWISFCGEVIFILFQPIIKFIFELIWLTKCGMVWRGRTHKVRGLLQFITNVKINIVTLDAFEIGKIRCNFWVGNAAIVCNFTISSEELLQSLLWVLKGLLERESLEAALAVNQWIVFNLCLETV